MSNRQEEKEEYSDNDNIDLFGSDASDDENDEPDDYEIHASNAINVQPLTLTICKKLEALGSHKVETAVKKLNTVLSAYDYDSLCHLVTVLLIEYYYSGWSVSDDVSKTVDSLFEDQYSNWNDDEYWTMIDNCKVSVAETLNNETVLVPVASKLLYEVYFGDGGCVFAETYQFINEFLSKLG